MHRQLIALEVTNFVVVSRRWDEQDKRVKTGKRDARKLCNRLDRYLCLVWTSLEANQRE